MGIIKQKKLDEVERLEQELRELKSLNRSLLKRLKKLDKGGSKRSKREKNEQLYVEEEESESTFNCPKCARADLERVSVLSRLFFKCDICGYRTKAEKRTE